jgi:hypothetical protein
MLTRLDTVFHECIINVLALRDVLYFISVSSMMFFINVLALRIALSNVYALLACWLAVVVMWEEQRSALLESERGGGEGGWNGGVGRLVHNDCPGALKKANPHRYQESLIRLRH